MSSHTKNGLSVTVLKLGGSLLDLSDLPTRLRAVFKLLGDDRRLLVCGGGDAADVVRRWHETHALKEEQSHWLAMEAVRINQRLLLALMPELELVSNRAAAEAAWRRGRVPLLDLMAFVSLDESTPDVNTKLPHSWDVTSDSLAGWVAIRWPASRLLLLKSGELPTVTGGVSFRCAAELGLVDEYFPSLASALPETCWCRMRGEANELKFYLFGR